MLGRQQKIFGCVLKSILYLSRRASSGNCSWGLRTCFVDFELLAEPFRRVCHNCFLWDHRIVLKDKSSFKERSFFPIVSGRIATLFWTFGPNFFGLIVETAFHVSIEMYFFWTKIFFGKLHRFFSSNSLSELKHFRLFWKKNRLVVKFAID